MDFPAGQEATSPVQDQPSDINSSTENVEAAKFWLNPDAVPAIPDGTAHRDMAPILLAKATRLKQGSLQMRANLSTASQGVDTTLIVQALLTRFLRRQP